MGLPTVPPSPFRDRQEAGRMLAQRLRSQRWARPLIVVGLARGGIPVAAEVAKVLRAPLEALVVRKIGAPGQPEWAVGAVGAVGAPGTIEALAPEGLVINEEAIRERDVGLGYVRREARALQPELQQRRARYAAGRPKVDWVGKTVIVVDDGLATGTTARAAVAALRRCGVGRLILAVPVGPAQTVQELATVCDGVICLLQPHPFQSVGTHYRHFPQLTDDDVMALLRRAA